MGVLHNSGSRAVLVVFCDHQDNEYESCEIEMSISQPIFTHKNDIKASTGQYYLYSTKREQNIVLVFRIFEL